MLQGSTDIFAVQIRSTAPGCDGMCRPMGIRNIGRLRAACAISISLALAGCAFPRQLQSIAVDHNQVVANTADSLTLLNILRARDGRPLHFTSISRISGNVEFRASGSVGGVAIVSGGNTASVSPGVTGSLASNPNFDITIHDSQAFQRGILQPMGPEAIALYLNTGWRSDLLTYVLVERIDFKLVNDGKTGATVNVGGRTFKPGDVMAALNNDPGSDTAARDFAAFVNCFTLSAPQGNDKTGVGLARTGSMDCKGQSITVRGGEAVIAHIDSDAENIDLSDPAGVGIRIEGKDQPIMVTPVITFRSVDGILYFLGEYARAQQARTNTGALLPIYMLPGKTSRNERDEPLLTIEKGHGQGSELAAEFEGVPWHVPANSRRTHQVIALIEQLFNLNKAGSALPLSTAVRVVN